MTWNPRTVKVTLYQGDYQQRIQEAGVAAEAAEMRLRVAREAEKKQLQVVRTLDEVPDEVPPSAALAEEFEALAKVHDDLVDEADAEAIEVTMQALPRLEWDALVEANPPRTDESIPESVREAEEDVGVNEKALSAALVPLSIVAISDDSVTIEDLIAGASSAQWDALYNAAFRLNRSLGADPKGAPRLLLSLSTPETAS